LLPFITHLQKMRLTIQIKKAEGSLLGDCGANMRGMDAELKATRKYSRRFAE